MKPLLDIIIPTYDNIGMLVQAIKSFELSTFGPMRSMIHYYIVNNGKAPLEKYLIESDNLTILSPGENLGWEGGLKLALTKCSAPIVLFANDDIRLIQGHKDMLWRMIAYFNDPKVGAVGPCSNFVMGPQNIFADFEERVLDVKYLIGFFLMVRREALDAVGSVDDTLPGGDDIDLSIRLRDHGYRLLCIRDAFVFHHGAATGNRVHQGYWNSNTMQEKTNLALIKKHGMRKFYETMVVGWMNSASYFEWGFGSEDVEAKICREFVIGSKVIELGCGGRKTVEGSIGVDLHGQGESIPHVTDGTESCKSDIVADVSMGLPFEPASQDTIIARHILEHCQDPIMTLSIWNGVLKTGGRLIIAVPDPTLGNTVLMNPEHVISFSPASLRKMAASCGLHEISVKKEINGVSFVAVYEKTATIDWLWREKPEPTVSPLGARLEEPTCV